MQHAASLPEAWAGRMRAMTPTSVLSDGTIRRLVDWRPHPHRAPGTPAMLQPASIDLRLGASFRSSRATRSRRSTSPTRPATSPRASRSPTTSPSSSTPASSSSGELRSTWSYLMTSWLASRGSRARAASASSSTRRPASSTRASRAADARDHEPHARPIVLWPGKPIAQLSFMTLDRPAERPFGHPTRQPLRRAGGGDREPLRGRPGRRAARAPGPLAPRPEPRRRAPRRGRGLELGSSCARPRRRRAASRPSHGRASRRGGRAA